MRKLYYLLYYKLILATSYVDRKTLDNPSMLWATLKAAFAVSALQIFLTFDIWNIAEIIMGQCFYNRDEDFPIYVYIYFILLAAFNYYNLDYKNKWMLYNEEFESYSKKKNHIINTIIISIYIIVIAGFFGIGEIWSTYYRAGLIADY